MITKNKTMPFAVAIPVAVIAAASFAPSAAFADDASFCNAMSDGVDIVAVDDLELPSVPAYAPDLDDGGEGVVSGESSVVDESVPDVADDAVASVDTPIVAPAVEEGGSPVADDGLIDDGFAVGLPADETVDSSSASPVYTPSVSPDSSDAADVEAEYKKGAANDRIEYGVRGDNPDVDEDGFADTPQHAVPGLPYLSKDLIDRINNGESLSADNKIKIEDLPAGVVCVITGDGSFGDCILGSSIWFWWNYGDDADGHCVYFYDVADSVLIAKDGRCVVLDRDGDGFADYGIIWRSGDVAVVDAFGHSVGRVDYSFDTSGLPSAPAFTPADTAETSGDDDTDGVEPGVSDGPGEAVEEDVFITDDVPYDGGLVNGIIIPADTNEADDLKIAEPISPTDTIGDLKRLPYTLPSDKKAEVKEASFSGDLPQTGDSDVPFVAGIGAILAAGIASVASFRRRFHK